MRGAKLRDKNLKRGHPTTQGKKWGHRPVTRVGHRAARGGGQGGRSVRREGKVALPDRFRSRYLHRSGLAKRAT